jgi:hypothetical protein
MALPRPASPRALVQDLRAFARQRSRHQWIAALFAIAMPVVIVVGFYFDSKTNIMPGEQIIYAESWSANRTDAEIKAQQKIDQQRRAEAEKARQEDFKKLEKRFGL